VITKIISIEELINIKPSSVNYLMQKGIRCIICGEPIWGTLEEACLEKGFNQEQIDEVVFEINQLKN
jgi:hypothetical protein